MNNDLNIPGSAMKKLKPKLMIEGENNLLKLNTCPGAVKPTINSRFPDSTFATSLALSRA
jgi:hypothetical protein